MTELGAGIDELEADLLHGPLLGVGEEGLSKGEDTLLGSNAASLQQDEVLLDFSVVGEATHWGDGLVSEVVLGGLHGVSGSHSVDLLVDISPVMVSLLSSPWRGGLDSAWMPSSNTGDLSETLVSFPW